MQARVLNNRVAVLVSFSKQAKVRCLEGKQACHLSGVVDGISLVTSGPVSNRNLPFSGLGRIGNQAQRRCSIRTDGRKNQY